MEDEKVTMLDYDSLMNVIYDLAKGGWGGEVKDKDGDNASSALGGTEAEVSCVRAQNPQALGHILDLRISPGGNDLIESVGLMTGAQALGSLAMTENECKEVENEIGGTPQNPQQQWALKWPIAFWPRGMLI